ncbi:aminotransferase class IV [Brevibacterium samyangense]|uniref:Aminodeoxychorismate lyase n=1 Tax=Brevibacterium samyangense TaxID=366888 RepID=A0ABP5F458_9MICO
MTDSAASPEATGPKPFGIFFADATELLALPAGATPTLTRVDPETATVSVFDLGLIRGDGIFEATTVWKGTPLAWGLHLTRLQKSAQMAELEIPPTEALVALTDEVLAQMGEVEYAQLKLMITRGADDSLSAAPKDAPLSIIAMVDCGKEPREPEIEIVTLDREVNKDSAQKAPWLLLGAKTLSYATNMAAKREYERRGAQNAVFITLDGYVMEGPQSTVVLREGGRVVTPHPSIGILHGTTQQELFAWAELTGLETAYEEITKDRLFTADQVWMMGASSVQSVRAIDGKPITHDIDTAIEISEFMKTEREAIDAWTAARAIGAPEEGVPVQGAHV